ncbi:MAG: hypothetical protein IKZ87_05080 [Actinomycetaceae bacterium]|nr:hypothetical protein [Actinomycetaceae bacterium]
MTEPSETLTPGQVPKPQAPAEGETLLARLENLDNPQEQIECLEEILQALNTDLSQAQG